MEKIKAFLYRYWKGLLSFLFFLAAFIFWGAAYPAHIAYHEQYQLFLLDKAYFLERLAVPGGMADYAAEYLTQFYYYPWLGALILALCYLLIQRLLWRLSRKQGAHEVYYPLTFLPALLLWHYMGDENAMLATAIALLTVLFACCSYADLKGRLDRTLHVVILIPLLYWTVGSAHFVFMGYVMLREFLAAIRNRNIWGGIGILWGTAILGVCSPLMAGMWIQFPVWRLVQGIGYHRFPIPIPPVLPLLALLLIVLPFLLPALPRIRRRTTLCGTLLTLATALFGSFFVPLGCDMDKEEALMYDHLIRFRRWDEVISRAERKSPTSPFGVVCLNLALGKTGQLPDRMFHFYQNGTQGLLPEFQRDFTSPLPTSEVYYHLGMVNTAQRFTFEAQEAIPNYRKSTRCYVRLAQTNLINHQYAVAAKYLHALQKTLFYRRWATETLTYLYDEDRINTHPEYGWLRQIRYTENFLYSDREMDMMLGLLFQHNHHNRLAYEYLMAYTLLRRDMDNFLKFYPLGRYADYNHIPRSYQEALIFHWVNTHRDFKGMPYAIDPVVLQSIEQFARTYQATPRDEQLLRSRFSDTYWYYLISKKQ